ncbi:MAG: hypothetical protein DME26_06060 [Verrucomicrobia bacterium]|nr:MAG: hypothetical protein DME26_06060 [Verrucomicrobiota bacterium]
MLLRSRNQRQLRPRERRLLDEQAQRQIQDDESAKVHPQGDAERDSSSVVATWKPGRFQPAGTAKETLVQGQRPKSWRMCSQRLRKGVRGKCFREHADTLDTLTAIAITRRLP